MENMMALRDLTPTDGPIGMKPVSVENFGVTEDFSRCYSGAARQFGRSSKRERLQPLYF
jgi:hypothetical protein